MARQLIRLSQAAQPRSKQSLTDSADEEENRTDSYDEIALLPASKRRKLQKLSRSQKDVELVRQSLPLDSVQQANTEIITRK